MGFRNPVTAAQIADVLNLTGDLDGGDPLSTFLDIDGGFPAIVNFDTIDDGGTP